jgi:MFS family permease
LETPPAKKNRTALGLIFLTLFIDMIGFGIVIPVLPLYAEDPAKFNASETQLAWIVGIYSLLQFVFSPIMGKISDRVGRKPVLVVSIIGTSIGFVVLGAATTVTMLLIGRIIDGISGGNISTAPLPKCAPAPSKRSASARSSAVVTAGQSRSPCSANLPGSRASRL